MRTARELMSSPEAVVRETASFDEVLSSVIAGGASEVYVLDHADRLLGVVTDYDLLKARFTQIDGSTGIDRLMCRNVPTTRPETDVCEISPAFRDCAYRQLTVVDDGRLIGVIRRQDILRTIAADDTHPSSDLAAERQNAEAAKPVRRPRFVQNDRSKSLRTI